MAVRQFASAVGFFAVLSTAGQVAAHPVLEFVERTETRPRENSDVKAGTQQSLLRVTLGGNHLVMETDGTRYIMDFEKRRTFNLKVGEKTFVEGSLFATLGFAAMELQNRVALSAMLRAAKVEADSMVPALAEHVFSLLAAGQNTVIDRIQQDGTTLFRWQGKELFSVSGSVQRLPPGYMPEYWRWVRYRVGGHPKIHAALQASEGVPASLYMLRPDVAEKHTTLQLRSVTNEADVPYSLAGYSRITPDREPWLTSRKIAADAGVGRQAAAGAATAARDAAAVGQGRLLDAILAEFTRSNVAGIEDNQWLAQVLNRVRTDPDARALASALSPTDATQLPKAIETLVALRGRTNSPYAYILDVFTANHHLAMRKPADAQRLLLGALAANPYLTGAWFDLGKVYYLTFRTEEAWTCWDTARALVPDHAVGRDISQLERKMLADHPEFF